MFLMFFLVIEKFPGELRLIICNDKRIGKMLHCCILHNLRANIRYNIAFSKTKSQSGLLKKQNL